MATRFPRRLSGTATATALVLAGIGCERDTGGLGPAPVDVDPIVFDDRLGPGVDFQAFLGSKLDALEFDTEQRHRGRASMRFTVPPPGDDTGLYAGGAFTALRERDFSGFNALTFWAKASRNISLDIAGFGNDNTGTSLFTAGRGAIPVTRSWTKHVIPIPLPSKLGAERGLFFFAEGFENDQGFDLWFDEVAFDHLDTVTNPRPTLLPTTQSVFVGQTVKMTGTRTTFRVDGVDVLVEHEPGYFTFSSSNEGVARIVDGEVRIVGGGTASITAMLGELNAGGAVTLNATVPPPVAAPRPTFPASDVISLFSNAYENRPVDTWSTPWDDADLFDIQIAGDDVKAYTNLVFAAAEFTSPTVDATAMTHFHVDVWAPDGFFIKLKLVDFGADGKFGGGDDDESQEIGFLLGPTPDPDLGTGGEWVSFDIPLGDFTGLANRGHLAQLIFLGNPTILYVDNVFFHK